MHFLLDRVEVAHRYFSSYTDLIEELDVVIGLEDVNLIESTLDKFPTTENLLDELIEKLKNKSVYKAFKKIISNPEQNKYEYIKCFSSLITHAAIECVAGHKEYELVISYLYEKLSKAIYQ